MKASEMTNEELAKALMSRVPLDSNNHDDIREASARLRKQDIIVAAQKAKGAAAKREREATRENSSQVGNAAKMREALVKADAAFRLISKSAWFIDANFAETIELMEAGKAIESALSAPPRNCDVGTAEEQNNRFKRFCDSKSMGYCWGRGCRKCMAQWGQMPYEEGDNE